MKYSERYLGEFTPAQRAKMQSSLDDLKKIQSNLEKTHRRPRSSSDDSASMIAVNTRSVVGDNKNDSMISFYAAAIGVMFLLFTSSGSAGALLDEAESGALDRVLSSRITMTRLLAGKLFYNTVLAFIQLVAMFLFGWAVFKLDFFSHLAGFTVMGLATAFSIVAAFGLLLASACHTRATWRTLHAAYSHHVFDRGQHVSALPDAREYAESRTAYAQRVGYRWVHQSILAQSSGNEPRPAGWGAARGGHCLVPGCAQSSSPLGVCLSKPRPEIFPRT